MIGDQARLFFGGVAKLASMPLPAKGLHSWLVATLPLPALASASERHALAKKAFPTGMATFQHVLSESADRTGPFASNVFFCQESNNL
jgi:hypothetical protein